MSAPGGPFGPVNAAVPGAPDDGSLPRLPGFREMALRRMAAGRQRLVGELAAQRQAAGLSQTQVAARMGTSQSAVARLEAGAADVRASTLERYAAAIGSEISWRLQDTPPGGELPPPGPSRPRVPDSAPGPIAGPGGQRVRGIPARPA